MLFRYYVIFWYPFIFSINIRYLYLDIHKTVFLFNIISSIFFMVIGAAGAGKVGVDDQWLYETHSYRDFLFLCRAKTLCGGFLLMWSTPVNFSQWIWQLYWWLIRSWWFWGVKIVFGVALEVGVFLLGRVLLCLYYFVHLVFSV